MQRSELDTTLEQNDRRPDTYKYIYIYLYIRTYIYEELRMLITNPIKILLKSTPRVG